MQSLLYRLFATHSKKELKSEMEPKYFEIIFAGIHGGVTRRIWVCIELNDEDRKVTSGNGELTIEAIERRTGILDLLPSGHNDDWRRKGRIRDHKDPRDRNKGPIFVNGHKVWISLEFTEDQTARHLEARSTIRRASVSSISPTNGALE